MVDAIEPQLKIDFFGAPAIWLTIPVKPEGLYGLCQAASVRMSIRERINKECVLAAAVSEGQGKAQQRICPCCS